MYSMIGFDLTCSLIMLIASSSSSIVFRLGAKSSCDPDEKNETCACGTTLFFETLLSVVRRAVRSKVVENMVEKAQRMMAAVCLHRLFLPSSPMLNSVRGTRFRLVHRLKVYESRRVHRKPSMQIQYSWWKERKDDSTTSC